MTKVPNNPGTSRIFWLSEEDKYISTSRMVRVSKLPPTRLTKAALKKTFKGWLLYVFVGAMAFWGWNTNANTWIILWLKALRNPDGSKRFSIQEINAIPIGGYTLQLVAMLIFALLSSRTGWRATWVIAQNVFFIIGGIILSAWPPGFVVKMIGFFFLWTSNAVGPILIVKAWMADVCPSPEERAIIVGVSTTTIYAVDSWANVLIYPASEAPVYTVGYRAATAFAVMSTLFTLSFKYLQRRTAIELKSCQRSEEAFIPQDGDIALQDVERKD